MLDIETRRRIDTARDILVGKVPDPKSQVEQITIALIYKFMDDLDAESEEFGGKRRFFAGEFARFGWASLMRGGLSGHDVLNLYAEAITRMPENPGVPALFRDIFNNAYLPYRDPETLRAFLKVIDEFTYDHSERLGDAFEYLLSVLGSQGDAGQFRTPRHIIDFIVDIIDPKKDESILDPACGTAGFLISSYKHILGANSDNEGNRTLTPDEDRKLADNISGYDISPDMVRLSLVNMYLHGFAQPHIFEYDTLTSEEKWNEYADVILANPPFMSPKGGIRPHNRFSVISKRSEVLFVDYMAEHLTPKGRAGIIVPEGIIFQSQNAHMQLRRMLVENYLVAVISLPAGVFNPYSGVKTSILILDRTLAKKTDHIAFFKVENDGFDLGAQRREIEKNDLPQVREELGRYLADVQAGESTDESGLESANHVAEHGVEYTTRNGQLNLGLIATKKKIAADGEYNLSGERYREKTDHKHSYPMVSLGDSELFQIESGGTPKSAIAEYWAGDIPWATLIDLRPTTLITEIKTTQRTISKVGLAKSSAKLIPENSVIVSTRATIGRIGINRVPLATNQGFKNIVIKNPLKVVPEFIALAMTKLVPTMEAWASGGTFKEISKSKFCELQIPLPPVKVQRQIVEEIEGYQRVIDGAQAVIDNWKPKIVVDPQWAIVELGEVISLEYGKPLKTENRVDGPIPVYGSNGIVGCHDDFIVEGPTIIVGRKGTAGAVNYCEKPCFPIDTTFYVQIRDKRQLDIRFCYYQLLSINLDKTNVQSGVPGLNRNDAYRKLIALPTLEIQQNIVAELEEERRSVAASKELVNRLGMKTSKVVNQIWLKSSNL